MRASAQRFLSAFLSFTARPDRWVVGAVASGALFGCTLITDVDREKIPQPAQPAFPEVDAGPGPDHPGLDAGTADASVDAGEVLDAGAADAAPDAAGAADASAASADAG
jgi:hypothetical protein